MKAIFKKELKSYFCSMTGYALVSFLIIFVGIYFMIYNMGYGYPYFSYTLSGVMLVLMVFVPVLTMRSFAEERKNRTDQLLLTSPVKIRDIVAGKYLAMVTVFCVPNAVFCLFPLIIRMQGNASLLSDYIAILEFVILGCTFIAAGMFFSSITESPMIAAVSTFAVTLVLYIWDTLMGYLPDSAGGNLAVIIPEMTDSSGLTGSLSSGTVLMNNCRAFGLGESSDDITVNAIMETSENGYLVSGSSQKKGSFAVGAAASYTAEKSDDGSEGDVASGNLIVFGSTTLIDDSITASFANLDNRTMFMNTVSSAAGSDGQTP